MFKYLITLLLVPSLVLGQATNPNNTLTIGQAASVADKGFVFNTGDGASNPKLVVDDATKALKYDQNILQIGTGSAADKSIVFAGVSKTFKYNNSTGEFNLDDDLEVTGEVQTNTLRARTGSEIAAESSIRNKLAQFFGTGNVQIRENGGFLEFSLDGSLFKKVGSGSGTAASGVNILVNPSFEDGASSSWSNTGGTYSQQTFTNSVEGDTKFVRLVASGSGQKICSALTTVPDNIGYGGMADFRYNQGDNVFGYTVLNSGGTVLASGSLADLTTWGKAATITFPLPSAGSTVQLCITSTGAGTIDVDNAYLGGNKGLIQVVPGQQSSFFHGGSTSGSTGDNTRKFTTNPENNGSGVYTTNFASQAVNGLNITLLVDARIEAVYCDTAAISNAMYIGVTYNANGATDLNSLTYATGMRGKADSHDTSNIRNTCASAIFVGTAGGVIRPQWGATQPADGNYNFFMIKATPLSGAQEAYTEEAAAWDFYGNIGGATVSTGTADITSYTELTDAGLDLVISTNSKGTGKIPCSSTNSPSGLTCSAGSESLGVVPDFPRAGKVRVCGTFGATPGVGVTAALQWVKTAVNAQTILEEGGERPMLTTSGAASVSDVDIVKVCGVLTVAKGESQALRLMHEMDTAGNTMSLFLNRGSANGQNDMAVSVEYLDNYVARPIIMPSALSAAVRWGPSLSSGQASLSGGAFATFNDSDFSYANAAKIGATVTQTNAGDIALKIADVPAGKYMIGWDGLVWSSSSTICGFRLYDGTNAFAHAYTDTPSGGLVSNDGKPAMVEYAAFQSSLEIKFQAYRVSGAGTCQVDVTSDTRSFQIYIYRIL